MLKHKFTTNLRYDVVNGKTWIPKLVMFQEMDIGYLLLMVGSLQKNKQKLSVKVPYPTMNPILNRLQW
jgi:hypothetical protein